MSEQKQPTSHSFFLTIEGLDGSGKTEISRRLVEILGGTGNESSRIKLTFEPHDPSCGGLFIRQVLIKKREYNPRLLALAFAANRADHLARDIVPFLESGDQRFVVCDRYYLSSLVYQSDVDNSIEEVMALNEGARRPDLCIFLNASDSVCYQRMRARSESKELFEANLRKTRDKYAQAIQFLRERGDLIEEVSANGTPDDVLDSVLAVLRRHGPHWLNVQSPLNMEVPSEHATLDNELRHHSFNGQSDKFASNTLVPSDLNREDLRDTKNQIEKEILNLPSNQVELLFMDYLSLFGYEIKGELPWSETKAIEISYQMPLGLIQNGVALLLNSKQHYSLITKKILSFEPDPDVPMIADFLVCFDFSNAEVELKYFERELVIKKQRISPNIRLITRSDLAKMALAKALSNFASDRFNSIIAIPGLKKRYAEVIEEWEVKPYLEAMQCRDTNSSSM